LCQVYYLRRMNIPTVRARLIEVQLPAAAPAGSEIALPDQPDLRGCIVTGVETFTLADVTKGPSGSDTIAAAEAEKLCLTMVENSVEKVKLIPYQSFNRALNGGDVRQFRDLRPTYEQCTIRVTDTLGTAVVEVALIVVHYQYESDRIGR
jgi:hypothetical protein